MDESTPAFLEADLGGTTEIFSLHTKDVFCNLSTRMVAQAHRSLSLISPDLEPVIYDQAPFISAVKQLALQSRVAQIRILVQDNSQLRQQGHRLIDLAQRLPSTIEIRKPDKEYPGLAESFLLVDDSGYTRHKLGGRFEATACFNDRLQVSQLEDVFSEAWERGEPDIELVRLHL